MEVQRDSEAPRPVCVCVCVCVCVLCVHPLLKGKKSSEARSLNN